MHSSPASPTFETCDTLWLQRARLDATPPKDLRVYDGTIRKLMLTPGIKPTPDDVLRVAERLESLGIRHLTINVFWNGDRQPNPADFAACKALLTHDFAFDVSVYSDAFVPMPVFDAQGLAATPDALQVAEAFAELGSFQCTPIVTDPKDPSRRSRMEDDLERILDWCGANRVGSALCIGDPARMDYEYLNRLSGLGAKGGVDRFDLHDTASSLSPAAATYFVHSYLEDCARGRDITLHIHDDFGMATASTTAAVAAGAHPDLALLGMSYRSGFAALEEVAVALEVLYGIETGLDLSQLRSACQFLGDLVGFEIDLLKSVVGRNQFLMNLPVWTVPMLSAGGPKYVASLYDPALVGAEAEIVWNHSFSDLALRLKIEGMGIRASPDLVGRVSQRIRQALADMEGGPNWLTDEEVGGMVRRAVDV